MIRNVLTIAGSDSGGGAGIQADLKAFSALGAYGASVITSLTAQSTQGVQSVMPVPPDFVGAQLDMVLNDIHFDSAKLGMLVNEAIVAAVAERLRCSPIPFVVLDTVMVAKGGHALMEQSAVTAIRDQMLPLADLITPNLPEAAALLGCQEARDEEEMRRQGRELLQLGCRAVLMKGGHLDNAESPDWLLIPDDEQRFTTTRVTTRHTHGTGCTLSAAIAALQPENGLVGAIREAKAYLSGALAAADQLSVGSGIGPTHHFYRWW